METNLNELAANLDRAFTAIADAAVELNDAEDETERKLLLRALRHRVAEWRKASEIFVKAQRQG